MTPQERGAWQHSRIEAGLRSGELVRIKNVIVCSTCGGNCGQCGNTDIIGNVPFSFDTIISSMKLGRPALTDRRWWEFWK